MLRRRDGDQRARAFIVVEPAQVGGAVLGDDDVGVHAPERDRSERLARRDDAADARPWPPMRRSATMRRPPAAQTPRAKSEAPPGPDIRPPGPISA